MPSSPRKARTPRGGPPSTPNGTFNSEAVLFLSLLKDFADARDQALAEQLGGLYKPSLLRDELLRWICLCAARREAKSKSDLQRDLRTYGGRATISRTLELLQAAGLVAIAPDTRRSNAELVLPTAAAVIFYNRVAPQVLGQVRLALL